MGTPIKSSFLLFSLGLLLWSNDLSRAALVRTAFLFEDQLKDVLDANVPANGVYDLRFRLFDDSVEGQPQGEILYFPGMDIVDGHVRVTLDFYPEANEPVFAGEARWLEISMRPTDPSTLSEYIPLYPRQEILPVPYALYALDGPFEAGVFHEWDGTKLRLRNQEGEWSQAVDLRGPKGDKGDQGPQGPAGDIPVPLELSGSNNDHILKIINSGNGSGLYAEGAIGVWGQSDDGTGVRGWGYTGVSGLGITGLYGSGSETGVKGSGGETGVKGSGNEYGVYGICFTSSGHGVHGKVTANNNYAAAVYGETDAGSPNAYAGYFHGRVHITGNLSKGSGSFLIDHPLDPENKYLRHSFVESPDMMNIYNGNVTLDDNGEAEVTLPEWFEALNQDFRYQLTAIGAPGPSLYIAEEISDNQFKIAGGKSGMKVSWQVTGVRHDPYAVANRIRVEEDKPLEERGLYLHAAAYGQPEEKSIDAMRNSQSTQNQQIAQAESTDD